MSLLRTYLFRMYLDSKRIPLGHDGLLEEFDCACEPRLNKSHKILVAPDVDWDDCWTQPLTTDPLLIDW